MQATIPNNFLKFFLSSLDKIINKWQFFWLHKIDVFFDALLNFLEGISADAA